MWLLVVILLSSAGSLLSGAQASGFVYERRGERMIPVANVSVSVRVPEERGVIATTKTGQDGRFGLSELPAGRLSFQASKYGYFARRAGGRQDSAISLDCTEADACSEIDFELVRGGIISGQAVDQYGEPLERVRLFLSAGDSPRPRGRRGRGSEGATTDDRGMFRIAGLEPGRYTLHASGGPRMGRGLYEGPPLTVDVTEGRETGGLQVMLSPAAGGGLRLSGTVSGVDLSGDGYHNISVRPIGNRGGRQRFFGGRSVRVGQDGQFAFTGLAVGRYAFSYGYRPGRGASRSFKRTMLGTVDLDRDISGLVLKPIPPTGVRGSVIFGSENPESRIVIWFSSRDGFGSSPVSVEPPEYQFEERQLFPGSYDIRSNSPDFYIRGIQRGSAVVPADDVYLAEGRVETIEVLVAADFGRVYGRIKAVPQAGQAEEVRWGEHFQVALAGAEGAQTVQADQNGRFSFQKVIPGDYRICAWPDLRPEMVRDESVWKKAGQAVRNFVVEGDSEVEIILTAAP